VATAAPRASRAITTAGLALAASFALLALVPLDQFRELAAALALGVLIDTVIVRSMLVPALVGLFGRAGRWPGGKNVSVGFITADAGVSQRVSRYVSHG
jgi:putative drug exporter of the RND superfamily